MRNLSETVLLTLLITLSTVQPVLAVSPETRANLSLLENALNTRIRRMDQKTQVDMIYRLYQFDVNLRNRVFRKTDDEIQMQLTDIKNGVISINRNPDEEEIDLTSNWTAVESLGEIKATQTSRVDLEVGNIRREKLLENADRVLISLGSIRQKDGSLSTINRKVFETKWNATRGAQRSSATLALSVFSVGLGVVSLPFVVLAVSTWNSSSSALWWASVAAQLK